MAIPLFATPALRPGPSPTQIAAQTARDIGTFETAIPAARAALQQKLAQAALQRAQAAGVPSQIALRQAQSAAFPALTQLRQAQIKGMPSKIALRTAQTGLAQVRTHQAGLPKETPAQQAINGYLTAFNQNPNSASTFLQGLAVKKAVQESAGTSITTPDGTVVSFGGSGKAGSSIPIFSGNKNPDGTPRPLTADQTALQRLFPPQPQPPIQQLPGTSGSRKVAGSTTVDTDAGTVATRPTRTVTSFNQLAIESLQKLPEALDKAVNGMAPFAGLIGKGKLFGEGVETGFGKGTPKQQLAVEKYNAGLNAAAIGATDVMRAVGAPNVFQLENEFKQIVEPRWNENPAMYRIRVKNDLMDVMRGFVSKAQAAQISGILLGTLDPKTLAITPTTKKAEKVQIATQVKVAAPPSTQSTAELIRIARGGT